MTRVAISIFILVMSTNVALTCPMEEKMLYLLPSPSETFDYTFTQSSSGISAVPIAKNTLPRRVVGEHSNSRSGIHFDTPRLSLAPSRAGGVVRICDAPILLAQDAIDRRRVLARASLLDGNVIAIDCTNNQKSDLVLQLKDPLPRAIHFSFVVAVPAAKGTWRAVSVETGWELLVAIASEASPGSRNLPAARLSGSGSMFVNIPEAFDGARISGLHIRRLSNTQTIGSVLFLDNIVIMD